MSQRRFLSTQNNSFMSLYCLGMTLLSWRSSGMPPLRYACFHPSASSLSMNWINNISLPWIVFLIPAINSLLYVVSYPQLNNLSFKITLHCVGFSWLIMISTAVSSLFSFSISPYLGF